MKKMLKIIDSYIKVGPPPPESSLEAGASRPRTERLPEAGADGMGM